MISDVNATLSASNPPAAPSPPAASTAQKRPAPEEGEITGAETETTSKGAGGEGGDVLARIQAGGVGARKGIKRPRGGASPRGGGPPRAGSVGGEGGSPAATTGAGAAAGNGNVGTENEEASVNTASGTADAGNNGNGNP